MWGPWGDRRTLTREPRGRLPRGTAIGSMSDMSGTEYDVERAVAGILASDLPHEFAEDLRRGGTLTEKAT